MYINFYHLQAKSFQDFWHKFEASTFCHFGASPPFNVTLVNSQCPPPEVACDDVLLRAWLFVLSYVAANLFMTLLTRYAEGAVYTSIVSALQTPLGAIFWTCLFSQQPFTWSPRFNETAAFTVGGLAVMTPGVLLYNFFSIEEAKQREEEQKMIDQLNEAIERENARY